MEWHFKIIPANAARFLQCVLRGQFLNTLRHKHYHMLQNCPFQVLIYAIVNRNLDQIMYHNIYQALHQYLCKNISSVIENIILSKVVT